MTKGNGRSILIDITVAFVLATTIQLGSVFLLPQHLNADTRFFFQFVLLIAGWVMFGSKLCDYIHRKNKR